MMRLQKIYEIYLKDLDKDYALLMLSMFFRRVAQGFLEVTRTIYLALIGFDPISIGIITSVGFGVSVVESTLFGVLSDKYGRKIFLALGNLMAAIRFLLYALSKDFWVLTVAQGLGALGEGAGAGQPVVSGYISDRERDGVKRAHIFSLIAITNALASSIGSLLAALPAYLREALGFSDVEAHIRLFWTGFLLSAFSLALTALLRDVSGGKKVGENRKSASSVKEPSALREIAVYSFIRSTDGLAMGFVSSLAPLYFYLRFNASSEDLAPVYALARFLPIPLYLVAPLLISKLGYVKPLIAVRAASGLCSLLLAIAENFSAASLIFILYMVLVEIGMPLRQAFATEIADESTVGSLVGVSNSIRTLVRSISPTAVGHFFQVSQFYTPFVIGASLFFFNAAQFHIFYSKRFRRKFV